MPADIRNNYCRSASLPIAATHAAAAAARIDIRHMRKKTTSKKRASIQRFKSALAANSEARRTSKRACTVDGTRIVNYICNGQLLKRVAAMRVPGRRNVGCTKVAAKVRMRLSCELSLFMPIVCPLLLRTSSHDRIA